jgi:hypothetical protein
MEASLYHGFDENPKGSSSGKLLMLYKLHAATYGDPFPNPDTLTMPFFDVSQKPRNSKDE